MKRPVCIFAAAFGLSAGFGLLGGGCGGNDCNCPETPAEPEPQGTFANLGVSFFAEDGGPAELPVRPENGTATVSADRLSFRYTQDGIDHEIVYEVVRQ
jgi:hypothetical protein